MTSEYWVIKRAKESEQSMNNKLDKLTKRLAWLPTRQGALGNVIVGVGAMALTCLCLADNAFAVVAES